MGLRFEWNHRKAVANSAKHGVTFDEASTVFGDALALVISDDLHSSEDEERLIVVVRSVRNRLLVVVYTRRKNRRRIISARTASRKERRTYEEGDPSCPKKDDEMLDEYDFSGGVRGMDFEQYHAGTNIVVLDSDVAKAFPDSASVNTALRALLKIARRATITAH